MRKIAALTAVSAAALLASPAAAQVVPGPRVEILGGWDNVKVKTSEFDGALDFLPENNLSDEALVYGVGAGYDFGMGPVAIGADLEFTKSQAELIVTDEDAFRYRAKGGRDLYVGARATFALSNSINFYLKGGYSRFRTKQSVYDATDPADPILLASDNKTFGGWRVGAGMHFTNGMFYAGPEYRYTRYEDGLRRHQLVAVAGIKFGPRAEPLPPPVVEAPPPPPPPPATQTCPDGSVILATEVCPAPPPPPPPPPPAPERG